MSEDLGYLTLSKHIIRNLTPRWTTINGGFYRGFDLKITIKAGAMEPLLKKVR